MTEKKYPETVYVVLDDEVTTNGENVFTSVQAVADVWDSKVVGVYKFHHAAKVTQASVLEVLDDYEGI